MSIRTNLIIEQGSDFSTEIVLADDNEELLDLTGQVGFSQLRKHYESANSVSFVVSVHNPGIVRLSLSSSVTSNLTPGRYVWDLYFKRDNLVSRICEGSVNITPSVTKSYV